jgi:hypothetical protein
MAVKTTVTMTDKTAAALRFYIGKEGLGMRAQSQVIETAINAFLRDRGIEVEKFGD